MIYLIGGSPRTGKSILTQRFAAKQNIGWVSTDMIVSMLMKVADKQPEWDASPAAITARCEWFFPYFADFVWRVSGMTENYLIEGVDFLPTQVAQLMKNYPIKSVFLGCSQMTLQRFDDFPGHSKGYAFLPDDLRRQFAEDVPKWSAFIEQEAHKHTVPYVDMSDDFPTRLDEAEAILLE